MRTSAPGLAPIFRSEAQLQILGELYVGAARTWTITALAERIGEPISTTAREVNRLAAAGIVTITAQGRNKLVGPNWSLPWAGPLAALLDRTIGPLYLLSEALTGVDALTQAWIYGSWAARHTGHPGPAPRDIDVVLVGDDLSRYSVVAATSSVADQVGVEVNPYLVSTGEWTRPRPDSFVAQVQAGPLVQVPLLSDDDA